MIRKTGFALLLTLGAAFGTGAFAAEPGAGIEAADGIEAQATVTAIDLPTRTVTLKTEDGEVTSLQVDPAVQNLDMLKVGDTVVATYIVAVAAEIAVPGTPVAPAQGAVDLPEKGSPGPIVAAQQVTARVTVNAVDTKANTVTLTGPEGGTKTVAVRDPELQARLRNLKVGDQVDITYTEAMAVKVERTTE
jgi:Cu/Ag efflux protein CusF